MPEKKFHMTILGRTIEHLGTQMYKHRAPSIAELLANSWDAGATSVNILIPESEHYNQSTSKISIMDNGEGMNETSVQNHYLVVGRNRRADDGGVSHDRKVMGRKGIGKLACFGLAEKITITTWTEKEPKAVCFSMTLSQLKTDAGKANDIVFPWQEVEKKSEWSVSGTLIELSELRHSTPIEISLLTETLARRFSRTTRGHMKIGINHVELIEPDIPVMYSFPQTSSYETVKLKSGKEIKYRYKFSLKPIKSKELQGFVIYANERTAQAPPFFFNVESTASSQHSTRYVTGDISANFLDDGVDDDSDVVSTDRQELDWEKDELTELREWGDSFVRGVLRQCGEMRGTQFESWILEDEGFSHRLSLLDPSVKKEISRFLKILGQKSEENDPRTKDLADSLIKAYEFRTFHDVVDEIELIGDDPDKLGELLTRLHDWKVLESRAILEIVRGRISIINKLEFLILSDAPETASSKSNDNLHDLLAEYPWIFNPEWQVFTEEKSLSAQLKEWGNTDCPDDMKNKRVDFLAFSKDTNDLIIIEMKRPSHPVDFQEVQRLEQYQVNLMKTREKCKRVLVYGGNVNIATAKWEEMQKSSDLEIMTWSKMFKRAKSFYQHYESLLNGDVSASGFQAKKDEVVRTREILESGTAHRSKADRDRGVGKGEA